MVINDFNHSIDNWIAALEQYDDTSLCIKPAPGSWSLGQLYTHLIDDTNYFIQQINICKATDENMFEEASSSAKSMFHNNAFPDEIIEGAPGNAFIPQPLGKTPLMQGLRKLKEEMNAVAVLVSESCFQGKTKHPGLNYFNAHEWLQFAEMHLRHHLRQKKRIDNYLRTTITDSKSLME